MEREKDSSDLGTVYQYPHNPDLPGTGLLGGDFKHLGP